MSREPGEKASPPASPREERRLLEERMAELERLVGDYEKRNQFFELLIKSLPGLFYLFDEEFTVHRWNKNVETVTEYSAEEIPKLNLFRLFEGENLKRMRESIQQVFETGEGVAETEIVTKGGRRVPYFFTGASARIEGVSYLLGMGLDISERKRVENDLRESEALYRIFAERMTEGVALCHDRRILFANNAFASMVEHDSPNALLSREITSLVSKGFELYFREMVEAIERGISTERSYQARWITRTGREIWVDGRANQIRWKGLPAVLLTARDITEAREREISMQEEAEHLRRENVTLRSSMKDRYRFGKLVGKSDLMQEVYELILNAAASSANVIIYGESGTGKELVARAIHELSSRRMKPFVPVNCSAIPENLLESEFFGHRKGAFTGAHSHKEGYLDLADGGTLFLDEVGELGTNLQAKLLRAIEGGGYSPVGANVSKTSDFRIVAATNKNLVEQANKGRMREDFFYRIHIIPITLPPLRQRKEDIPLLLEHFLSLYADRSRPHTIPGQVMDALMNHDWPGNVRELQNVVQRYLAVGRLDFLAPAGTEPQPSAEPTPPAPDPAGPPPSPPPLPAAPRPTGEAVRLRESLMSTEEVVLRETLERTGGNRTRAAALLGISRKTLYRKMTRLGIRTR